MGLRFTSSENEVALFDSVTGWAFGPTFSTEEAAERFLKWAEGQGVENGDVRILDTPALYGLWERYCQETEHPVAGTQEANDERADRAHHAPASAMAVSEHQTVQRGWTGIRVSEVVKDRLAQLARERAEDWGRSVSYNEVIEQLLADRWGDKP